MLTIEYCCDDKFLMDESKHQTGQAYWEERWATIGYQISGE